VKSVSDDDRVRWDRRYAGRRAVSVDDVGLPSAFQAFAEMFPTGGHALDLACGPGGAAVWLAQRGMDVYACDVSPVAIDHARALAELCDCAARCRFEIVDLDQGLPAGPPVELLLCTKFRDPRLDLAIIERLAVGGLLAISALSEVGAAPGPFRAKAGELRRAFDVLDVIAADDAHGETWLLARRRDHPVAGSSC
jgi:SAM-dependent methyltransferase